MNYEDIVTNESCPTLVLAGPGAGKTYLLSDRIKRLLAKGVEHDKISVVTFGRDAKENMRNNLLDPHGDFSIPYDKLPHISTLNSLGLEILNLKPRVVGLKKTDLRIQVNETAKRLLFRDAAFINNLEESESHFSLGCKVRGDCEVGREENHCKVCNTYWQVMSACNYVDFDDQVIFANRILESEADILEKFQSQSVHLLVDEYQDINAAQFRLIKNISSNSRNGLFVVGDDAQSIYSFRGADPNFILNFHENYADAITPPLAHSRRCPKQILAPAEKMLKQFYADWKGPFDIDFHVEDTEPPIVRQLPSEKKEALMTARVVQEAIREKKSVLILAPKKDFFPTISKTLNQYGVSHSSPTSPLPTSINKRLVVIQNLLNWVQIPSDSFLTRVAMEELLNHSTAKVPGAKKDRNCTEKTIQKRISVETEVANLWVEVTRKADLFSNLIKSKNLSEELDKLRSIMIKLLELYDNSDSEKDVEFISEFCIASGVWRKSLTFINDLQSIMKALSRENPTGFGLVQLMTMRKAKGLQADVVVIVGLEDDIMPGMSNNIEEEARLFYVSMTRAKEKLYLYHAFARPRNISFGSSIVKKDRSRFLDAIGIKSIYTP